MLDKVRVVLVGTSHAGNIGSVARAMKTMGISKLYLVAPQTEIDGQSIALAAGASDVLANASIVDNLHAAISDCHLVIGTSARSRTLEWPMLDGREAGIKLAQESAEGEVALVFGRERTGLSNEELQQCHYHVCLPANPEYSSLNLAMAVQILCYEVRMASLTQYPLKTQAYPLVEELERFYQHLERTLSRVDFLINPKVMDKLRRMFNRVRMEKQELNTMRGVLTAVDKALDANKNKPE